MELRIKQLLTLSEWQLCKGFLLPGKLSSNAHIHLARLLMVQAPFINRNRITPTRSHTDAHTQQHTHTRTHLLRTVIANSVVECILRAKTLQLHLTGMGRWRDPKKYQEATIAIASVVEVKNCFEKIVEISPRLRQRTYRSSKNDNEVKLQTVRRGGSWVGHVPCLDSKILCRHVGMISPNILPTHE